MSTTPRIRLRRTRKSRFRLASFSMVSKSLPSGAYYYTLTADGKSITKSMLLLK